MQSGCKENFLFYKNFLTVCSNFGLYVIVQKDSGRILKRPISQDLNKVSSETRICVPFIWHTSNPGAKSRGSDPSRAKPCNRICKIFLFTKYDEARMFKKSYQVVVTLADIWKIFETCDHIFFCQDGDGWIDKVMDNI